MFLLHRKKDVVNINLVPFPSLHTPPHLPSPNVHHEAGSFAIAIHVGVE